jgi:hypothetical protein
MHTTHIYLVVGILQLLMSGGGFMLSTPLLLFPLPLLPLLLFLLTRRGQKDGLHYL